MSGGLELLIAAQHPDGERSGEQKPAPAELGDQRFREVEDAPGSYVLDT